MIQENNNNAFLDKELCIKEIFKQHFEIGVDENFPQTEGDRNIIDYFEEGFKAGITQTNKENSYIVFENSHEQEGLVQLSITLSTLEKARKYVKAWKNKTLYIYQLIE